MQSPLGHGFHFIKGISEYEYTSNLEQELPILIASKAIPNPVYHSPIPQSVYHDSLPFYIPACLAASPFIIITSLYGQSFNISS